MNKALYLRDDVHRLYVSRKRESGLARTEDIIDISIQQLKDCIKKCWRRLITVARNNTDNTRINRIKITRKQKWEEKQLHEYFKQETSEISHKKTWRWLRKRNLSRETKNLYIASQNNDIRSNYVKARIDKMQQNSKCQLCSDRDRMINHIIRKCSKLVQ